MSVPAKITWIVFIHLHITVVTFAFAVTGKNSHTLLQNLTSKRPKTTDKRLLLFSKAELSVGAKSDKTLPT